MTAIWTLPRTWATGEIVTAAMLNQYLRDELDYLKARPVARVSDLDGTVSNTSSTSFVDITGATTSITTSGSSRLLIAANISWSHSVGAQTLFVTALVDGTNQGDATNGITWGASASTIVYSLSMVHITTAAVSDAAHTVKLQYRISSGTATVVGFDMAVMEVF
jgi:hypothetical protein